jgi:hypothetical protein
LKIIFRRETFSQRDAIERPIMRHRDFRKFVLGIDNACIARRPCRDEAANYLALVPYAYGGMRLDCMT